MCKHLRSLSIIFLLILGRGVFGQDRLENSAKPAPSYDIRGPAAVQNVPAGISSEQADAILKELRAIHQLLERQQGVAGVRPAVPPDKVRMRVAAGWYSIGRDDAPVTLVEFADYQCPFCRLFQSETFAQLKENYIDTGKVRFVSRDLPLQFHPDAQRAAEAALCAGNHNKYWEMRDVLIAHSTDLSRDAILRYAQSLALDVPSFRSCLDEERHKSSIQRDMADAQMLQISGTPTFVLGKSDKGTIEGQRIVGALPYAAFDSAIRRLLSEAASPKSNAQGGH